MRADAQLQGSSAGPDDVVLVSAVINGSTVYGAPELFAAYRTRLGKPIDVDNVRAIAAALSDLYHDDGYARPELEVDSALVAAGVLRFEVHEARIDTVVVSGDAGPHRARLEQLGGGLASAAPVREAEVHDTLRRMRELPGLTLAASTARDATQPNVYRLDLAAEFSPVSGSVRLSNRGTDEVGPNFLLGQVAANGLLGGNTTFGALFGAAVGDVAEYRGAGGLASTVLDGGTQLGATLFRSRSDPQEAVDRDDRYVRDRATLRATLPERRGAWAPFVGTRLDDLTISRAGAPLRDERLRIVEGGVVLRAERSNGTQSAASIELVKGLDAFGSGLRASDLSTDARRADFTLTRMTFARLQPLGSRWSLRLDAFAQHTVHVLPYAERFKIGGDRLGRGFEVAEIAGDQGLGAKVEARRSLSRAPVVLGRTSFYGFYDIGAAFKQDEPGRESAATAGVGLGTRTERTTAAIELAQPLTHADIEGENDFRLFVELAVSF